MRFQIITDTCCDFPAAMYEELGLVAVPLQLRFREQEHTDISENFLKTVYAGLRCGENATTSAVNPTCWAEYAEPALAAGKDVLIIAFSSGLSTTYQSAVIAAQELAEKYPQQKIRVVDSLCASMGQGLFVWYACQKRDAGLSLEETAAWCEENKQRLCHWFTVDDLFYLKRGGRIGAATAVLGTMLQIKPVLHVDNQGKLVSVSKARGRKAALDALVAKAAQTGLPGENSTMFISHGDCLEDAQYVADQLKQKCGVQEVVISYVGGVIGSHSGPGTLALFFLGNHR